jgi:hypothetical protein
MDMMWAIVSSREALERFGRIDCCAISLPLRLIPQSSLRLVLMRAPRPRRSKMKQARDIGLRENEESNSKPAKKPAPKGAGSRINNAA